MNNVLARLDVGDRLPWKLGDDGEPLWLIVAEVLSPTSPLPDGRTEILIDSH